MTQLVIGVGNETCGDDAAGLLVTRLLAADAPPGVECVEAPFDALSLIDRWAGAALVVVVDAASAGAAPGTIVRLDARAAPLPATLRQVSSHGFGVLEAIELARALGRLPERLVVYGIEGARFAPGDAPSPDVIGALDALAARIRSELASGSMSR